MIKSSMGNIRLIGRSSTIDDLCSELNEAQLEASRSALHFSVLSTEFVSVVVPVTSSALSLLAGIVISRIQNRKVRVRFKNHPYLEEVEVSNLEDLKKLLKEVEEMRIDS